MAETGLDSRAGMIRQAINSSPNPLGKTPNRAVRNQQPTQAPETTSEVCIQDYSSAIQVPNRNDPTF